MKNSIYFSVIIGFTFLIIRFIGLFLELSYNDLFLYIGLGVLLLITLPLVLLDRYRYRKQKEMIIRSFQHKKTNRKGKETKETEPHDYPSFRKQKSGLTWGGGNMHGSSAKRGSKRGFLRH